MYQPQQPHAVILQPAIVSPTICESYKSAQSTAYGVTLIIAGALSIVFNIIGIVVLEVMFFDVWGFWSGIMVSWFRFTVPMAVNAK